MEKYPRFQQLPLTIQFGYPMRKIVRYEWDYPRLRLSFKCSSVSAGIYKNKLRKKGIQSGFMFPMELIGIPIMSAGWQRGQQMFGSFCQITLGSEKYFSWLK